MRKMMMFCLIACGVCFSSAAFAEGTFLDGIEKCEVGGNKVYIRPHQVYITENGISIFIEGEQFLAHQLNCDE